ncbi:MAG TPA: hypothetical protein PLS00_09390 [Niabella sp.]|nr:hypothetical protein [Niabella sp.]
MTKLPVCFCFGQDDEYYLKLWSVIVKCIKEVQKSWTRDETIDDFLSVITNAKKGEYK